MSDQPEVHPDVPDEAVWQAVETFPSTSEASVADGALRAAGIPTRLLEDDSLGSAGGSAMPGESGGAEVQVPLDRVDEARAVLGGRSVTPPPA